MKLFKKQTDEEFTLAQKINFTQEEFAKLRAAGKSILQPSVAKKVTKKPKRRKNVVVEENGKEDSDKAKKKNIDPVLSTNMVK